ncbi:MAG TPA: efflux RND transporter periplasmic adaptor subunit [Polyangia bacterium]
MRRRARRAVVGGALVVAVATAAMTLARGSGGPPAGTYKTETVTVSDLAVRVSAPGRLDLVAPVLVPAPMAGLVAESRVDEGERVRPGQVLARLQTNALESEQAQAEAARRQAEARADGAASSVASLEGATERARHLASDDLISAEGLERLEGELTRARHELEAAKAAFMGASAAEAATRRRRSQAVITAPCAGVVVRRELARGLAVRPEGPPLFVIAPDLGTLTLTAEIDEADVGAVGADAAATFTVPGHPGRTFAATLVRVRTEPTRASGGVTYGALLRADNREGLLRPGMTAAVTFTVARHAHALVVPEAALRFSPDGHRGERGRVFLMRGPALVEVPVVAHLSDGAVTEVSGALAPGDRVVVGVLSPGKAHARREGSP